MQVIIYPNDVGGVAVVYPAPEFADHIEAIAAKDVPDLRVWVEAEATEENPDGGRYEMVARPWRIVTVTELPPAEARSLWRWTEDGPLAVAVPEPQPEPIPQVVSRMQARIALFNAGLLPAVEAAVAQASPFVQMAWQDAQEFRRTSQTISALKAAVGLTDEQLDQLFRDAALIEA